MLSAIILGKAMIDLDKTQLTLVKGILNTYVPQRRVAAFGSRVQGTARKFSDLDLVIMGDEPVAPDVLSDLRHAFAESDLSIHVDVLEWQRLSPSFRRAIEGTLVELAQPPIEATPLPPSNRGVLQCNSACLKNVPVNMPRSTSLSQP
jgi:predicted nucleotidyltransferase